MTTRGYVVLGGAIAVALLVYAGSCWVFPFAHCPRRRCDGGKIKRDDGKVWRLCRWCAGTGRRLRIGRRLFNALVRVRDRAG